jgi:hypothetical protein
MIASRNLVIVSILATLTLLLGVPLSTHAATSTFVVNVDGQSGWHSLVTDGNGSPDTTYGSVTFVTGPGTPPLGVGSLRLQTNPGKGDGSAQLRNTLYAGVKLTDLTNLTYWAYSAVNNGQQFPYLTLAVSYTVPSPGTDTLFFELPYQQPFTGNPSCPDQGPTAMNTWQKWDALHGCWWDNNAELGSGGLLGVQPLSVFISNHSDAAIYNPSSLGGLRVAVGFASSTDNFDGNVDAVTIAHSTTKTTYNFEPAECKESDGNGDFHSGHGEGNFNFDNDHCMDGDQNQVSSSNRGDGQSFQSTQINTVTMDSATRSITITGLGLSGGLPVAFTFAAVETGLTTPGWVSFSFSHGYTNAGTLTNGVVVLH